MLGPGYNCHKENHQNRELLQPRIGSKYNYNNCIQEMADNKPTQSDVLLGRGIGTNRHPGNIRFRAIVSEHAVGKALIFDDFKNRSLQLHC
mmetsp:Transcript_45161/g.94744  ORF Transcript_45161/g.94744 Transcript_45161/m.94744 type:complete len:91 (+) Transcript_45161:139-411(+)